jgi:hypothetical protein
MDIIPNTIDAVRAAFESIKADFREERLPVVASRMGGDALLWGEHLLALYRSEGRDELAGRDPLTRFWVLRFRGMPEPADLTGAPPGAAFVLAFTSFPYLDALMEVWSLGEVVGGSEDHLELQYLTDGVDQGGTVVAERRDGRWGFDLMPLYMEKAEALERFITGHFDGDFERFVRQYAADHDLAFDIEQAWRPLEGA